MSVKDLLCRMEEIMAIDERTLAQRFFKTGEEFGELSEAISCTTGAIGCGYKGKTTEDVVEESWDLAICAISIALHADKDKSYDEHVDILGRKIGKWRTKVKEELAQRDKA